MASALLLISLSVHRHSWEWPGDNVVDFFNMLLPFDLVLGSSGGSDGKKFACNAGDPGSIPGSRRSPGEGNGYPLQYSCLENSMDREAWQATVHGVTEVDTAQQLTLSLSTFCFIDFSLLTSNFQFIDLCSNLYCFFSSAYLDLVFFLKFCEVEA